MAYQSNTRFVFIINLTRKRVEDLCVEEGLSFDGELPHWEPPSCPLLLSGLQRGFVGGQGLADGAGLLGPQVQGDVLLVLQKRTKK